MEKIIAALPFLLKGAFVTLQIAFVSIFIGLACGVLVGILNCNKMGHPALKPLLNAFVWIVRGTPLFVQVLIAYYALPELISISLSPFFAGSLALGVNSTAYISEIVRGGINAIGEGQWEAAHVIGLSPLQTLKGIILPQMIRISLPSLINEMTALIKETSLLMVIGVTELTKVSQGIVARELDPLTIYLTAAVLYLAMTSTVTLMAKRGEA